MAMRPKKVAEQPFFADSPGPSPSRLRKAGEAPSPARFLRASEKSPGRISPASSPGVTNKPKGNDFRQVRSPGFLGTRAKAKAKVERDRLIAQDVRRSSVIQRDDDIGMELLDAPPKRTSRSGLEEDDFFEEMDGYGYGSFYAKGGAVSSASETPTFAQSPTEDEAVREPPSRGRTSKPSKSERSPPQTSLFSSEEDSSPSPKKVQEESKRVPQSYTKRNSNSFLSESEESPSPRRRVPAKFQETLSPLKSEPVKKQRFQAMDLHRTRSSESVMNFPPEDVTLTFEPLSPEDKEPQMAPESESDAILSQDLEDLPQALIPEDPGSPQAVDRSEKRLEATKPEVEPLPALKVTAPSTHASGTGTPPFEAFSPDVKRGHRLSKVEDTSTTSASTSTPSGDSRFMSPSAASELSRSPFNDQEHANLKQQLEELEEQQKQIQSGLKEALQHHRRLWADELARCQEVSQELEKALEEERRQHAEQIKEWEQRLQSELSKKESQWREEVDGLVKEVERLRMRCREHFQTRKSAETKPITEETTSTSGDQELAKMMESLSQTLQDPVSLSTTMTSPKEVETPKEVRMEILKKPEVKSPEDLTLPIGAARQVEATSVTLPEKRVPPLASKLEDIRPVHDAPVLASPTRQASASPPRQAVSSPYAANRGAGSSPIALELPAPVLVPQDGTPSSSPLRRIRPKVVQNFLDATPKGPPLPARIPTDVAAAYGYSRALSPPATPVQLPTSPSWTPSLQHLGESSPGPAVFPSPQALPMEPVAQVMGPTSPQRGSPSRFEANHPSWRRRGFDPSLM